MSKNISLAEQVDLLFKHGRERGLPVTYRAIAKATGETGNNLFRIRRGQNTNPGLRTLVALVTYFKTDLGYFSCKTKEECLNYLHQSSQKTSDHMPKSDPIKHELP
jgi:transcriptional regulator with XRE-family HTH domain